MTKTRRDILLDSLLLTGALVLGRQVEALSVPVVDPPCRPDTPRSNTYVGSSIVMNGMIVGHVRIRNKMLHISNLSVRNAY